MLRLRGSTIIEALIAMTITITVFGATLTLFMNIRRDMNQPLKAKAVVQIGNEMAELKKKKAFQTGKYTIDNLIIEKVIKKADDQPELTLLVIRAIRKDNGLILLQRRIWILNNDIIVNSDIQEKHGSEF